MAQFRTACTAAAMALATFGIASAQPPAGAQSPDAQSPDAQSPGAQPPGAQSPGAQSPGAQSPGAQSPGAQSPGSIQAVNQPPPALELQGQQEVSLTPEEMRSQSAGAVGSIEAASTMVQGMLSAARDQRDVVRVLCLDDKQNQIDVALSTARDRSTAMTDALGRGATERAQHEFTLLMVLKERVDVLVGEANQCVGEEVGFTGDSEVEVQVDPNLPDTEPGLVDVIPIVAIPPGPSSPID